MTLVITGAQIPATQIASDARNNLTNSVRVILEYGRALAGVIVVFGSRIIRGCRAKKVSESALDAFNSYNAPLLGTIGIDIRMNSGAIEAREHGWPFAPVNRFDDRIISLTLVPGLQSSLLTGLIDSGVKGIVLRAYGTGDVPHLLFPALEYAREKEIPVIITTQCPDGATMIGRNEPGRQAMELGIVPAYDMSMEAMTTKLMWLLGQDFGYAETCRFMLHNFAGEIDAVASGIGTMRP